MTRADAFLQAVLDDPDADAPRLVFADWLDEHGDPDRAEFIRVQCTLDDPPPGAPRTALWARQGDLLARHGPEWAAPVNRVAGAWTFRRGFIEEAAADFESFLSGADDVFLQHPVQYLHLTWGRRPPIPVGFPFAARLADCPPVGRLKGLDLSHNRLGSDGVRALAVCPHLGRLTALNLSWNSIGDAGARALAGWELLPRLTHLDLRGNAVGPDGVRALARALEVHAAHGEAPCLRSLTLRDNNIGEAGRRAILYSPLLRRAAQL
jgi:uncharacterized protein (TIGR02996 family)